MTSRYKLVHEEMVVQFQARSDRLEGKLVELELHEMDPHQCVELIEAIAPHAQVLTFIMTLKYFLVRPKKLILCFSGTVCVTFNPSIKNFYRISSVHIEKSSILSELLV